MAPLSFPFFPVFWVFPFGRDFTFYPGHDAERRFQGLQLQLAFHRVDFHETI
jgi:hypothetical protein